MTALTFAKMSSVVWSQCRAAAAVSVDQKVFQMFPDEEGSTFNRTPRQPDLVLFPSNHLAHGLGGNLPLVRAGHFVPNAGRQEGSQLVGGELFDGSEFVVELTELRVRCQEMPGEMLHLADHMS